MDDQQTIDAIGELMREIQHYEQRLEEAAERRTQLATRLYMEHGPRTYMVDGEELLISRTKARKDGSVSYFFAAKHRWAKKGVAATGVRNAINEAFEGLERAGLTPTPLTGRVIEATAVLTGRAQAGEGSDDLRRVLGPGCEALHLDHRMIGDPASTALPLDNRSPLINQADLIEAGHTLQVAPFLTHCPECKQEYVNIQHPAKPLGVIMSRRCGCTVETLPGEFNESITVVRRPSDAQIAIEEAEEMAEIERVRGLLQERFEQGQAMGGASPAQAELGLQADQILGVITQETGKTINAAPSVELFAEPPQRPLGFDPLASLSPEELASVPAPSEAEIEAAVKQGQRDADAFLAANRGRRLPIAREAAPEPKLLQITEPHEGDTVGLDLETAGPDGTIQALMSDGTAVPLDSDAEDLAFLMRGFEPDPDPKEAMQAALSKPRRSKPHKGEAPRAPESLKDEPPEFDSILNELGIDLDE